MNGWIERPPYGELRSWVKCFGRFELVVYGPQKHGFRLGMLNGRGLGGDSAEFYPSLEAAEAAFRALVRGWLDRTP